MGRACWVRVPAIGPGMLDFMQEFRRRPARRIVVPSRSDSFLAKSTEVVGGPLGKHTAPGQTRTGFFSVERVLVLMVLASGLLALLFKDHCRRAGWVTPDQYSTTCYSEFPNAFGTYRIGEVFPFSAANTGFDYPPLTGLIAGVTAWLSGFAGTGDARVLGFFDLNAFLLVLVWLIGVLALARSNRRRPWDAAVFAASPLLLFTAFSSWDLWAAALSAVALFLLSRRRAMASGVVLGLAVSVQPYAGLILLAAALVLWRRGFRSVLFHLLVGGLLSWLVVNLPVMLLSRPAWFNFWTDAWNGKPATGSFYYLGNALAERIGVGGIDPVAASLVSAALLLLGVLGVAVLCFKTGQTPRLAQLAVLLVGWFLVVDKYAVPEHLVWLLPLFALARPRWRALLIWQLFGILFYLAQLLHLGVVLGDNNAQHGIDLPYYALAVLTSNIVTLVMLALVVRDVLDPRRDLLRRGGVDDPLLDGFTARRLP